MTAHCPLGRLLLLSRLPVGLSKQTVSACRAIVSDVTSEQQRSDAISGLVGTMALGYALGPYVGGLLIDHAHQFTQLPAYLCSIAFICLAPLIHFRLPETSRAIAARVSARPARSPAGSPARQSGSAWRQPQLLALLAACALPEAAVIAGSTALPLFAMQHLGWQASRLGAFTSVWCAFMRGGVVRQGGWVCAHTEKDESPNFLMPAA